MADRQGSEPTREFRLEGFALVLCGGALLALLGGAFLLGRWVERAACVPEVLGAEVAGPLAQVATAAAAPEADAARGQTYFDSLEGAEKAPEPGREVDERSGGLPAVRPEPGAGPSTAPAAPSGGGGAYFVQVSALRDERGASELIDALKAQGWGVRLFSEREGSGHLYKVRVGGYDSEQAAREAAERLRAAGYAGAWVTAAD